jgi:hypothetical protein
MYDVKIIADSLLERASDKMRLTTMECTYPLIIHNEVMTHRMFSRNTASNRAIPVQRMIDSVKLDPFIPERWPKNQSGMQNEAWLDEEESRYARLQWCIARNVAVDQARELQERGVHKQITNRLLGPFLWTTAIISATEWDNFFSLRCHPVAQPEMRHLAYLMQRAYYESEPRRLKPEEWHTPYVPGQTVGHFDSIEELDKDPDLKWNLFVSAGRCARVSYLRQGEKNDAAADFALALKLTGPGHWSPFEHVAEARFTTKFIGNFRGFKQLRKFFPDENRAKFTPNYREYFNEHDSTSKK